MDQKSGSERLMARGGVGRRASRAETLVGACVLVLLAGVAVWLLTTQAEFNPALLAVEGGGAPEVPAAVCGSFDMDGLSVPGLLAAGEIETFDAKNLPEKINGKADQYVSAGFRCLTTRGFVAAADPAAWIEVYVYDMASFDNSYAVWSVQRRPGAAALDIGDHCYLAENGVFCARGGVYFEIIASCSEPLLMEPALEIARAIVRAGSGETDTIAELAIFPTAHLEVNSLGKIATDAFGVQGFDEVFTARYRLGEEELRAYLALRGSEDDAQERADAYASMLESLGGTAQPVEGIPGARRYDLFGATTVILTHRRIVAGVQDAASSSAAMELARALYVEAGAVP
jgi:hypothetical protein